MKEGVRILALDESPFKRGDRSVMVVGVIARQDVIEGVLSFNVEKDGTDSTDMIIKRLRGSRFASQIRIVAINGITLAGLNIVDFPRLGKELNVQVIGITRKKPHPRLLKMASNKVKEKRAERSELLDKVTKSVKIKRSMGYYAQYIGPAPEDDTIEKSARFLRLSHLIASGIGYGESKGRV